MAVVRGGGTEQREREENYNTTERGNRRRGVRACEGR